MKIAGALLDHVQEHPSTLIHYYGAYSVTLEHRTHPIYMCVMKNLFDTAFIPAALGFQAKVVISDCWDLKGALFLREALSEAEREAQDTSSGTCLDLDWMALGRSVSAEESDESRVVQQIEDDTNFLAAHGCLDYSMLLACATIVPEEASQNMKGVKLPESPTVLQQDERIYMLGIVDITETWRCKWAVQGLVLGCCLRLLYACNPKPQLSPNSTTAVHPSAYAKRFTTFMNDVIFQLPSRHPTGPAPQCGALADASQLGDTQLV